MEKLFLFYCSNECGATEDGDRKDTTYTQEINIMWCLYGRGKGDTKQVKSDLLNCGSSKPD